MIQIYSTHLMVEADVIKSILDENDIESVLWDKRTATVYPVIQIRVMVQEKDFEKAEKIIQDYRREERKNEDDKQENSRTK